ncbi:MAG: hypothetical protein JW743_12620 [Deltaproteobacteria bacterium]|nr:hypothetical protein [Deltaproteobacteria bacterium]
MAEIHGQTGISYWIKDFTYDQSIISMKYTDTDTGSSLDLRFITISGGTIDPITSTANTITTDGLLHPVYFDSNDSVMTYDIFTISDSSLSVDGQTMLFINRPDWTQYLSFSVGNIVFCDKDLGALDIGNISNPNSYLFITAHGGPSWEYGFQTEIDQFKYVYSGNYQSVTSEGGFAFDAEDEHYYYTGPRDILTEEIESLSIEGIHFSATSGGTVHQPSTWSFDGLFKIGDLFNTTASNPATMDVVTFTTDGTTHIMLNLPMTGSFRIEDVNFGGNDFGPCAIDGIDVQRLQFDISP